MSSQKTPWTVIVPVKALGVGKSRLSTRTAADRGRLSLAFARDVIDACLNTAGVGSVLVVSRDEQVRSAADRAGARSTAEPAGADLNAALRHGSDLARTVEPLTALAMVAADLPALRAVDLERALAIAARHPRTFVSDVAGTGTTMLSVAAEVEVDPRFGPRSRAAHAASGAVDLVDPDLVRLRCDVDTEVDLWHATTLGLGPHTRAVVQHVEATAG